MSELEQLLRTHYDGMESGDGDLAVSVFADDVVTITPAGELHTAAAFRAQWRCRSW